jgi:Yip1 domain
MNCPKCNKSIPADARFCGGCGQQIAAAAGPVSQTPTSAMLGAHATAAAGGAGAAASNAWAAAAPFAPALLSRLKNIVLSPKTEWPVIAFEPTTVPQLYVGYIVPLALLAALMGFLRISVLGVNSAFGYRFRMPISSGLTYTLTMFVSALFGVFVVGVVINTLAATFSGTRDQRQALKVAAYSLAPAMLSSVLALSPIWPTLLQLLAGFYGIYVLYLGLPVLMQSPKEKAFGYTASVVICTILVGIVFAVLSTFAHIGGARPGLFAATGATAVERAADRAAARDRGAAIVGNVLGNALGTDSQGKASLSAALSNLAKAGEQAQASNAATGSAPGTAPAAAAPAPDPGQATADAAQNAPSPLTAAGGLLTALGGAMGGPHRVDTVDFKTLKDVLPVDISGNGVDMRSLEQSLGQIDLARLESMKDVGAK